MNGCVPQAAEILQRVLTLKIIIDMCLPFQIANPLVQQNNRELNHLRLPWSKRNENHPWKPLEGSCHIPRNSVATWMRSMTFPPRKSRLRVIYNNIMALFREVGVVFIGSAAAKDVVPFKTNALISGCAAVDVSPLVQTRNNINLHPYPLRTAKLEKTLWIIKSDLCQEDTVGGNRTQNLWFHSQVFQPLSYPAVQYMLRPIFLHLSRIAELLLGYPVYSYVRMSRECYVCTFLVKSCC